LRMISRPHGDKPPASMRWHVTLNLATWGRQGEGADIRVHGVGERRSGCFLRERRPRSGGRLKTSACAEAAGLHPATITTPIHLLPPPPTPMCRAYTQYRPPCDLGVLPHVDAGQQGLGSLVLQLLQGHDASAGVDEPGLVLSTRGTPTTHNTHNVHACTHTCMRAGKHERWRTQKA
jgi:hypothetical protein